MKDRKVWVWNDLSPADGCSLVRFTMAAQSLDEVAAAVRRLPTAQNTTVGKLVKSGLARTARGAEAIPGSESPGAVVPNECAHPLGCRHDGLMVSESNTEDLVLTIAGTFNLTGRGAAVIGPIESGDLRAGEEVEIWDGTQLMATARATFELINSRTPDPRSIGLLLSGVSKQQLRPGRTVRRRGTLNPRPEMPRLVGEPADARNVWQRPQRSRSALIESGHDHRMGRAAPRLRHGRRRTRVACRCREVWCDLRPCMG